MKELNKTIEEIKAYAKINGIKYEEISKQTGLSLSTIKGIFRGAVDPKLSNVQKIEECLGLKKSPTRNFRISDKELHEPIIEDFKNQGLYDKYLQLEEKHKKSISKILEELINSYSDN